MTLSNKSSIKRKVMAAIMLASTAVLLMTAAAFMIYDLVTFRQTMVENLMTQARTIAENSTAALAFRNDADAANVLATLRTDPHITAAAIYDAKGKLFVKYPASMPGAGLPAEPQSAGYHFGEYNLIVFQPVVQSATPLGTLYLQSDLSALSQRLKLYGAISLLIIGGSLLVAFWLSFTLQKKISNPIITLAGVAREISEQHNYSLRAAKSSDDEMGLLTDSFNNMLERIQASDAALRASEAQFRLVTDQAPVLLAHMDSDYRYKFVNRHYAERYGRKPEEIIGKHAVEIVGQALFEKARPYVDKALAGQPVQYELEIPGINQERRWSHVEYTPEKNPAGQTVGFVAAHTDITLRKRTEMEMETARDQALAASRAKDDFLAALSHELRTPLNPVLLLASESAEDARLPAEVRAQFATIRNNVELEARLIDDLLDLTRITRGKLLLDEQTLDAHEVLQEAVSIVRDDAAKKQIKMTLEFRAERPVICGDPVRLQQIFWNVLKNAVKFTPEGGHITVRTFAEDGTLFIKIIDTGIGLNAEELKRVFRAFAQGDHAESGSHRFGGLGLGLAISQKLAELHGGIIQASSGGRDKGATFTIRLPLNAGTNHQGSGGKSAPVKTIQTSARGNRILLVEDHEPTRTALAHLLARRNFEVLTAASLTEGRELARRNKIDLLISDIGLPDGSGHALMSELQQIYGISGIALTGYGMEEDVAHSQRVGFIAHLTKPVRIQSLDVALANALGASDDFSKMTS